MRFQKLMPALVLALATVLAPSVSKAQGCLIDGVTSAGAGTFEDGWTMVFPAVSGIATPTIRGLVSIHNPMQNTGSTATPTIVYRIRQVAVPNKQCPVSLANLPTCTLPDAVFEAPTGPFCGFNTLRSPCAAPGDLASYVLAPGETAFEVLTLDPSAPTVVQIEYDIQSGLGTRLNVPPQAELWAVLDNPAIPGGAAAIPGPVTDHQQLLRNGCK